MRWSALDAVAVRAAVTRLARMQDWGPHADRVEQWCWAALGDALDDLAALAPAQLRRRRPSSGTAHCCATCAPTSGCRRPSGAEPPQAPLSGRAVSD